MILCWTSWIACRQYMLQRQVTNHKYPIGTQIRELGAISQLWDLCLKLKQFHAISCGILLEYDSYSSVKI